jgi:hypothetical protein
VGGRRGNVSGRWRREREMYRCTDRHGNASAAAGGQAGGQTSICGELKRAEGSERGDKLVVELLRVVSVGRRSGQKPPRAPYPSRC